MMSNKWAFSLTTLITIFAFAFVVTPAMAADDFDATLSVTRVSTTSDHNAAYNEDIEVTLTFGAQVDGTKATLTIFVEDKHGRLDSVSAPGIMRKDLNAQTMAIENNNKVFVFTIPASATDENDVKVHILVAKGVAEIVPVGSVKTSKEGKLTIDLVGPDEEGPTVVSIALASGVIVPAAGYTGATIDVIITLSEAPKEFKKDHINITEATVADPVALDPVAEPSASEIETRFSQAGLGSPPPLYGLYDATDMDGDTLANDPDTDVDEAANGIHRRINEGDYKDPEDDAAWELEMTTIPTAGSPDGTVPPEAAKTLATAVSVDDAGGYPVEIPAGTDRTVVPKKPVITDFTSVADYNAARDFYTSWSTMKKAYDAEVARRKAYDDAVAAEMKKDTDARDMYYAEQFGTPVPRGSGHDSMLHPFLVTITPKYANKNAVVVKVKEWEEQRIPTTPGESPRKYAPPPTEAEYMEGTNKLTIKIGKEVLADKTAGIEVKLLNEGIIPKDGYLVVAKDKGGSAVRDPGDAKKSPASTARQPFALTYNLIDGGLPNLEAFLINGGTIDLVAPNDGLVISEIMWGTDASIADSFKSQYIEIRNTSGAEIKMGDGTHKLIFYPAGSALPAASTVKDRVGTVGAHGYWSVVGKGQSGRTGLGEAPGDVVAITPTKELISMQRAAGATAGTLAADGTDPMSWGASSPPGLNFDPNKEGQRIGSPGRAPTTYPTAPAPPATPEPDTPVAERGDIVITEIMVDTSNGRLPQWIELSNISGKEVSLAGWSLRISNSEDDTDVVGDSLSINLSGTLGISEHEGNTGKGKTLLLVGGTARSSSNLAGSDRIMNVSEQLDETGRYTFISPMAFMVALVPPQKTGVLTYGDIAGNLNATEAWDIPMSEGARSSLIRRETDYKPDMAGHIPSKMFTGTEAKGWILASSTSLVKGPTTWYGSDEDAGTPGYNAGGPLPVELSMFYPARDRVTGAVVIKWETQSELNNAGFFIKRSQQRSTNFKVINAAMIPGAGTTSEKQSYTYTDTTAQPNVVYYYQIEDVSLDGNRQLLTRGIRLRGHIGAAGKATVIWGELKTSNE